MYVICKIIITGNGVRFKISCHRSAVHGVLLLQTYPTNIWRCESFNLISANAVMCSNFLIKFTSNAAWIDTDSLTVGVVNQLTFSLWFLNWTIVHLIKLSTTSSFYWTIAYWYLLSISSSIFISRITTGNLL